MVKQWRLVSTFNTFCITINLPIYLVFDGFVLFVVYKSLHFAYSFVNLICNIDDLVSFAQLISLIFQRATEQKKTLFREIMK